MKTFSLVPRPQIVCDCCGAIATRKGGSFPFYLCAKCALLPEREIAAGWHRRYSGPRPIEQTCMREHYEGTCECRDEEYVAVVCGAGRWKGVGAILE